MSNKYLIFKWVGPPAVRKTGLRTQRISNSQISEKAKFNYILWIRSSWLMTHSLFSLKYLRTVYCTWKILSKPTEFWEKNSKPINRWLFFFLLYMCRLLYYLYSRDFQTLAVLSDWSVCNVTMEFLPNLAAKCKELDNEALMLTKVYPWK